jgi:hypothetical protein
MEIDTITASVFVGEGDDAGHVGLVLRGSPMCEFDGGIHPGCAMTPESARKLAGQLMEFADRVETIHGII